MAPILASSSSAVRCDGASANRRPNRRRALALFVAPTLAIASRRASALELVKNDYDKDASAVLSLQRELLRDGKGDVDAYENVSKSFFENYKFDHKGHTNSFSQLLNNDAIIAEQKSYLTSKGLGWSEERMPGSETPKGKMLDAYIRNGERCLVKEGYPAFNEMDKATRAEWKAIECTQGLVNPQ
jgi:hypothetical protein